MKQTLNAQIGRKPKLDVGRWALGVGRFPKELP
jgi:hypothetical protein